jgi:protein-tyrosine-phosphatase
MTAPKKIVFLCVENANRSQMAEAFARIHGGDRVPVLGLRVRSTRRPLSPCENSATT